MRCQIGTGESLKQKIVIVHLRWVLVLWSSDVTQYDENMANKQSQCGGGGISNDNDGSPFLIWSLIVLYREVIQKMLYKQKKNQ